MAPRFATSRSSSARPIQELDEEVPGPRETDPVGDVALPVAEFALVSRIEVERRHEFDREPLAEAVGEIRLHHVGRPRSQRGEAAMWSKLLACYGLGQASSLPHIRQIVAARDEMKR